MFKITFLLIILTLILSGCGKNKETSTDSVSTLESTSIFKRFNYSREGTCENYNVKYRYVAFDPLSVPAIYKSRAKVFINLYLKANGQAMLHSKRVEYSRDGDSSATSGRQWLKFQWHLDGNQLVIDELGTVDFITHNRVPSLRLSVNHDFKEVVELSSEKIIGSLNQWDQGELRQYSDQENVLMCQDALSIIEW
ncbi:MAG: hypothetical protein EHM20_07770 [Alphaproteobacteria bacterium]|nr:MAG: hypothetical protein EHM20_07770 [Alphaproteobacteria bacterium]